MQIKRENTEAADIILKCEKGNGDCWSTNYYTKRVTLDGKKLTAWHRFTGLPKSQESVKTLVHYT